MIRNLCRAFYLVYFACTLTKTFVRRIVRLSVYAEASKGIYAIARIPMSTVNMGPSYQTQDGMLDKILCVSARSEQVVTIWFTGTVDALWFKSKNGDVLQLGSLTLKLLDNQSQGLTNSLLNKFNKNKDKSEHLSLDTDLSLTYISQTWLYITPDQDTQNFFVGKT